MSQDAPIVVNMEFLLQPDGSTRLLWRSVLFGETETAFAPPYAGAALSVVMQTLDALQSLRTIHDPASQALLAKHGLWASGRIVPDAAEVVGRALFDALGQAGQSNLRGALNHGNFERRALTFVLRFPQRTVELAALPWELLHDGVDFVLLRSARQANTLERYVTMERSVAPPQPEHTVPHLLALLPQHGIPPAVREQERQARLQTWNELRDQGLMTYDEITPLTREALAQYMLRAPQPPDIVHYYGHGMFENGHGYLRFDAEGGSSKVSADQLRRLLGDVRLIVMHACQSSMTDVTTAATGGLLSGIGPSLSVVAGAVVAMQLSIRITAATHFVGMFYHEVLLQQHSVQQAVAVARQSLQFIEEDAASWYVPNVYIRGSEQKPVYIRIAQSLAPTTQSEPKAEPQRPAPAPAPQLITKTTRAGPFQLTLVPQNNGAALQIEQQDGEDVSELRLKITGVAVIVTPKQPPVIARLAANASTTLALTLAPAGQSAASLEIDLAYRVSGRLQEQWATLPVVYEPPINNPVQSPTVVPKPVRVGDVRYEPPINNPVQSPKPASTAVDPIVETKRRRLRHLQQQAAYRGPLVDPSILMEIEDLEREIRDRGG